MLMRFPTRLIGQTFSKVKLTTKPTSIMAATFLKQKRKISLHCSCREYCKSLYFRVISRFDTFSRRFKFTMHYIFLCKLYIRKHFVRILNSRVIKFANLAKIKFSRIIVNLQYGVIIHS